MLLLCILCTVNICAVDGRRLKYMMDSLDTHQGLPHYIKRSSIFDDAVTSTRMSFRIFFMSIWELASFKYFDGGRLLIPAVHAQIDMSLFPVLGSILVHGFMTSGFLPVRIVL